MIATNAYAAKDSHSGIEPFKFDREDPKPNEVEIEVLFCGICHTDIHLAKDEWKTTVYPCVPGHEMTGRVRSVGATVTRHAVGDIVGIGCMVDSCRQCEPCRTGDQNYCEGPNSFLGTYNGPTIAAKAAASGTNMYGRDNTFGGYSDVMVVAEDFVVKIPAGMDPAAAAPILCAGATTYSELKHYKIGPSSRVGIVGLGGLGHMAVKIASAMGAEVTVFTTTSEKQAEAEALGAKFAIMEEVAQAEMIKMSAKPGRFDYIMSTIPVTHDINPYIALLKREGTISVLGSMDPLVPFNNILVNYHRRNISGSLIGNIADTQEILDFCAEHCILPDIEIIPIQEINAAHEKLKSGDVRFRYVIDCASLRQSNG